MSTLRDRIQRATAAMNQGSVLLVDSQAFQEAVRGVEDGAKKTALLDMRKQGEVNGVQIFWSATIGEGLVPCRPARDLVERGDFEEAVREYWRNVDDGSRVGRPPYVLLNRDEVNGYRETREDLEAILDEFRADYIVEERVGPTLVPLRVAEDVLDYTEP